MTGFASQTAAVDNENSLTGFASQTAAADNDDLPCILLFDSVARDRETKAVYQSNGTYDEIKFLRSFKSTAENIRKYGLYGQLRHCSYFITNYSISGAFQHGFALPFRARIS